MIGPPPPLPRAFFARPTEAVAEDLLGTLVVRQRPDGAQIARIVEVEAYLGPHDRASHSRRGPTPRAAIMFGPPGHLYVYLIYGMYHCMNFVAKADAAAGAVLIRAAEPLRGLPDDARALAGPGKLCRALGVDLGHKGLDLTDGQSPLYVAANPGPRPRVARSPRIGIDYAGAWARRLLRFYDPRSASVSGPRRRG